MRRDGEVWFDAGCYNSVRGVRMLEAKDASLRVWQSRRYWFVIVLVVCALTTSVATRTSTPALHHGTVVESLLTHTVRQHLAMDAVGWAPPVVSVAFVLAVSFYPRVSPGGPPIPNLLFDETLYNRPPPSC